MNTDVEKIWTACLEQIKQNINPQTFHTWFKPIIPLKFYDDRLTVQVPSGFYYEWIEQHYRDLIDSTLFKLLGKKVNIHYTIDINNNYLSSEKSSLEEQKIPPSSYYERDETRLNSRYTFENFVEGSSNQFAKAASLAVANAPGRTSFNPLLIYGGVGLGKTHLIQAIGNHALSHGLAKKIRYVSSEKFTLDFITAIQNNRATEFSTRYRNVDLLLVDDIQFFVNKERTLEVFFHTFNELHQQGKQIVLSCDRPPNELMGLEERLVSRFNSGLIADIQLPDLETRIAILQKKSEQDGIQLPPEVTIFIATNITSNIRDLEGALIKLLAYASLNSADITLDLAKTVLKDIIKKKNTNVSIELIQQTVADYFGIKDDLLRAKTRRKEIALARQLAMYLVKEITNNSLKTIGLHFGGRDHSTVIHACQIIKDKLDSDKKFKDIVSEIKRKIEILTQ
ncbi:chromosomal replication initiator protein DnaA [candidate division KSB1 bacterium]|nr:MAG: chromosomal replication initiator protein DnaA [candidate division KSB1 bacterium]RKY88926.1 MAG: chromosomal replication initiator protein DnaA [candidate division KSB1 bacterium]RKY91890.1 MAG: chromosomal replication initiator protein DnaA [candidate division KSB1 bacterium]